METEVQTHHPKTILFVASGLVVFFVLAALLLYAWAQPYEKKIAPNVFVGSVSVGSLSPEKAEELLQTKIDTIMEQGISVTVEGVTKPVALSTLSETDLIEDVSFDVEAAIADAMRVRHHPNPFTQTWLLVSNLWQKEYIALPVSLASAHIQQSVYILFPDAETLGQDSRFIFSVSGSEWKIETTKDIPGNEFAWFAFFETLSGSLSQLQAPTMTLSLEKHASEITQTIADTQKEAALAILNRAPFSFTTQQESEQPLNWVVSPRVLSTFLLPGNNGNISVDPEAFQTFLDPIAKTLERPAQNARLKIENGKVADFVPAKHGERLDRENLLTAFSNTLNSSSNEPIEITFLAEPPEVENADVNDLGITEILGVGTSSYKGSPKNRRGNIQNGVNLLNGRLISPDEVFSLVEALKPFTIANGYTPELVIKGDKITPEIGGGLCQIGTTTFRAVMNSGLPVTERHNHSLVVSYYNDPSNKKPGTDATIYDPNPDFKFTNDTGHYLLLQTENLIETQELKFTFWGTSDGRKGSYEPPTVLRWIPAGEAKNIETPDLKPGEQKCQEAHVGADASFTYTIARPDGTQEVTPFTSHYRPLPKICLVGVEKIETPAPVTDIPPVAPVVE
ncbi:MAG: VanW family protein [Patescibacteria group bacterium]|mgnify:CR=1 FL=1